MTKSIFNLGWLFVFLSSTTAYALTTELGVSYSRKKNSYNADNSTVTETVTGSVSFYFAECLALETSYTDAIGVREEKTVSGTTVFSQQTIVQTTQVYGVDLIWVLADKRSFLQPYLKGGAAQLTRFQEVKDHLTQNVIAIPKQTNYVPSYGAGFKVLISDGLSIKISYDAWRTPQGEGITTNDDQIRAGLTWMF